MIIKLTDWDGYDILVNVSQINFVQKTDYGSKIYIDRETHIQVIETPAEIFDNIEKQKT